MAETWGSRYAKYPDFPPALSSINPYQLLSVSDHVGADAKIENTPAPDGELKKVTVVEAWWRGRFPASFPRRLLDGLAKDPRSDFYIGIQEFIPDFPLQLREFASHAGNHFTIRSAAGAELRATLSRANF